MAKKLATHSGGEFVKQSLVASAKLLALHKGKLFHVVAVSLEKKEASQGRLIIRQHKTQKDTTRNFQFFSLACNETADTTQLDMRENDYIFIFKKAF